MKRLIILTMFSLIIGLSSCSRGYYGVSAGTGYPYYGPTYYGGGGVYYRSYPRYYGHYHGGGYGGYHGRGYYGGGHAGGNWGGHYGHGGHR